MDVSSLFSNETDDTAPPPKPTRYPSALPDSPSVLPDNPPRTEPTLTPVQRIRAFRDGSLEFPDITEENTPDDDTQGTFADDDADETLVNDDLHDDNNTKFDDGEETDNDPSPQPALAKWIEKKRKPLAIAGTLIAVGAIVTAILPPDHDKATHTTTTRNSTHSSPPPTPTEAFGDKAITPETVDVGRDDCAVGSTPPLDAFNAAPGENRSAWICQRPFAAPGTIMTITLPTATTISEISSVPGFDGKAPDGTDTWPKYQLVAAATWYFDNGTPKQQRFTTKRETQAVTFDPPVVTKTIRLVINETIDVPRSQMSSPTVSTTAPGLLGGLQDWGQQLGGSATPGPISPGPTGGGSSPSTNGSGSAFALGSIQIIGHPSR